MRDFTMGDSVEIACLASKRGCYIGTPVRQDDGYVLIYPPCGAEQKRLMNKATLKLIAASLGSTIFTVRSSSDEVPGYHDLLDDPEWRFVDNTDGVDIRLEDYVKDFLG